MLVVTHVLFLHSHAAPIDASSGSFDVNRILTPELA
jgi:hypothetical protein